MTYNEDHTHTKTVVLTGGTGAFGRFLALEFLKYEGVKLVLLVRGASHEEAHGRMRDIIGKEHKRVEVLKADLAREHLGLTKPEYNELTKRTTHILHAAASTRFNLSLEEARLHNVTTTEKMLLFAKECPRLVRFGFVSTATVAGKRSGLIKEDEFEHNAGFHNTYQQSKHEAEALVRANAKKFPIAIFRPPFLIAPTELLSRKGQKSFLTVLISLIAQERLPYVPGTEKSIMDIANAVDAARAIVQLMLKDKLSHTTYHITHGEKALTVQTLHRMIEEKWGKRIPVEYCGDAESLLRRVSQMSDRPDLQAVYERGKSFLMEPAHSKMFDNSHTLSELDILQLGEEPIETLRIVFRDELWNSSD